MQRQRSITRRQLHTSFYVYLLIALMAALWATTMAALVWHQRGEQELADVLNDYHLASAEWAARAGKASTTLLWLTRTRQTAMVTASTAGGQGPMTAFAEFLGLLEEEFHRLSQYRQQLEEREKTYGEPHSTQIFMRFKRALTEAQATIPPDELGLGAQPLLAAFLERVEILDLRSEQLVRFHMAEHDLLAAHKTQAQGNSLVALLAFLAIVIGAGVATLAVILRRIRRSDSALRRSERQYRGILQNMLDTYYRTDGDGCITMATASAEGLFGCPVDDLIGQRLAKFYAGPDGPSAFLDAIAAGNGEIENYTAPLSRTDGDVIWVSTSARLLLDDDGDVAGLEGVIRNVTDQHRAEQALKDTQDRIVAITEMAPEAVISLDAHQRIVLFNRGAERIFGYAADEMLGEPLDRLLPQAVRNGHARHIRAFAASRDGHRMMGTRGDIMAVRKSGEEFPAEASIAKLHIGGELMFTVMLHDITDRRQAEQAAQQALHHAETANAAKSRFLATMSHELRTPLNAVIGFAQILAQEILGPMGNKAYVEYANDIERSGQHLLAIISDILDLARIDSGQLELHESVVNLGELLEGCRRMLARQAEEKDLDLALLDTGQEVELWADQRLLRQTVLNLFSNAVKFTPAGGHVEARVSRRHNQDLIISVEDTGIGMDPDALKRAFEPFVQADDALTRQYEGTGLGLSLSKSFVELHGGTIEIQSTPGIGTTVSLVFPGHLIVDDDPSAALREVS